MGIFLKEMVLDLPRVVDAKAVRELDLFECFAIQFGAQNNRPKAEEFGVADSSSQRIIE